MLSNKEYNILQSIYLHPRTLQSNYVRKYMREVAKLASQGFITTKVGNTWGNTWLISRQGLLILEAGVNE